MATAKKYKINNELFEEKDFLKDCPDSKFIPTNLPAVKRIIAIGDIHGDVNLARRSLKLANLIDDDDNWVANPPDTVVVQVGDQIDSCRPIKNVYDCHNQRHSYDVPEDMAVVKFFNDMQKKAEKVGGAVYSLLGNHELMNAQGNFDYVSYSNFYEFDYKADDGNIYQGPEGRKRAFKPGGPVSKLFACDRKSVLVIGSTMFIHAGILPILAEKLEYLNIDGRSKLRYLNSVVRKWLLHKLSEISKDDASMFIGNMILSPFWTRIYGQIPENTSLESNECFTSVKKTFEVFKIGKIVVGHTPQLFTNNDGINGTCYGKDGEKNLYRIDGGFSKAFQIFGSKYLVQVLEIINDQEFRIITDTYMDEYGKKETISINESQMPNVSYIYSQNRIRT
ncbi:MAG: hypothetical protein Satyrvirus2_42 [Satyrvirus sp.]|uniref:Calcineurin-like phosphoesterase domain-containing protein n=1 Tax=Satyrvirus sp. TaxID=2487771 RepID=A0A3G5AFH9_9VIRU|nr:MAG: hypothetical protein Satyrvirus2_42 [Satyrvirus sp.]